MKEVANLGTGRKILPKQSPSTPLERYSANIAEDELRLLAGAGIKALQKMAAYIPASDSESLAQADEMRPKLSYQERQIFHLIRIYHGHFSRVYNEWLYWASLSKAQVPPEVLPFLLDLGANIHESQALTKRLVGARGRWLARHRDSEKWAWLAQVEVGKIPRLGKQKKQEERVIALFKPAHYYLLGGNVRVAIADLSHPWTLRFSESLLETIQGVFVQNALRNSADQIDIIRLSQFHFHPNLYMEFQRLLESNTRDPEVLKVLENMGRLMEFRRDVRESFAIVDE